MIEAQIGFELAVAKACFAVDLFLIILRVDADRGLVLVKDLIGFGYLAELGCWSLLEGDSFFFEVCDLAFKLCPGF